MTSATLNQDLIDFDRQLNELVLDRREVNDALVKATSFDERRQLTDRARELEERSRELEQAKREYIAKNRTERPVAPSAAQGQSPTPRPQRVPPDRPTIDPVQTNGATMPKPTFELYERVWGNSVHTEPVPAVSLSTTSITLNALAMKAIGVSVGDSLSLYISRDAGLIALKKPPKGWSTNKSSKIGTVKASGAGVLNSLATFLRWAGVKPKQAKGIYQLAYDEELDHWTFELPDGSWTKPTTGTPVGQAGSTTRGRGRTSAAKRADLPATSPHRA